MPQRSHAHSLKQISFRRFFLSLSYQIIHLVQILMAFWLHTLENLFGEFHYGHTQTVVLKRQKPFSFRRKRSNYIYIMIFNESYKLKHSVSNISSFLLTIRVNKDSHLIPTKHIVHYDITFLCRKFPQKKHVKFLYSRSVESYVRRIELIWILLF